SGTHVRRTVRHRTVDADGFRGADSWLLLGALGADLALRAHVSWPGIVDLNAGQHARSRRADGDGHGDSIDLPLGLRLSARLDAAALLVHRPADPNDMDDRCFPRRDPARRRLARALAARP